MKMRRIKYDHDKGNIILPNGPPFDGNPVLIRTNTGIVEAWWDMGEVRTDHEGVDNSTGWCWVCYDDKFQEYLDDATHWCPLPVVKL